MRVLIYLLVLTASTTVFACPDISGTYTSEEGWIIKYEQTGCQQLTRSRGIRGAEGRVAFRLDRILPLNGNAICNSSNYCEAVFAEETSIRIAFNHVGTALTLHGSCSQQGYTLTKDEMGNLIARYPNATCPDGFRGEVAKVLTGASASLRSELPSPQPL